MPGTQPGMPTHLVVGVRTAPVLLQEHPQPLRRRLELVVGIDGTKHRILLNPGIERGDEPLERRMAPDGVEESRAFDGSLDPYRLRSRRRRHRVIVTEPVWRAARP